MRNYPKILKNKTAIAMACLLVGAALLTLPKYGHRAGADWTDNWGWTFSDSDTFETLWNGGRTGTQTVSGDVYQQSGMTQNGTGTNCTLTAYIAWRTQNTNSAQVTVSTNGGQEQLFASGPNGSQSANWMQPGNNYKFTLWNVANGNPTWVDDTWVSAAANACTGNGATNQGSNTWYQPSGNLNDMGSTDSWQAWINSRPLLIDPPQTYRTRDNWGWTWN